MQAKDAPTDLYKLVRSWATPHENVVSHPRPSAIRCIDICETHINGNALIAQLHGMVKNFDHGQFRLRFALG